MFILKGVCGQRVYVRRQSSHGDVTLAHTHTCVSDDADYARSQMLYQQISVTNTDAQNSPSVTQWMESKAIHTPLKSMRFLPSVIAPRRLSFSSSRGEKNFSIFILLHLSAEVWRKKKTGFKHQCLAHKRRMGWFRLSTPLLCDLPPPLCLSAALWRNSRGVQKCPSPVCLSTQPAGQSTGQHKS